MLSTRGSRPPGEARLGGRLTTLPPSKVKYPWPLSNRDYVYARRARREEDGTIVMVGTCGFDQAAAEPGLGSKPAQKGVVRIDNYRSDFAVRATETGCEFCILYEDDLKGSIPSAVMK
jgi:hypothetical protein